MAVPQVKKELGELTAIGFWYVTMCQEAPYLSPQKQYYGLQMVANLSSARIVSHSRSVHWLPIVTRLQSLFHRNHRLYSQQAQAHWHTPKHNTHHSRLPVLK